MKQLQATTQPTAVLEIPCEPPKTKCDNVVPNASESLSTNRICLSPINKPKVVFNSQAAPSESGSKKVSINTEIIKCFYCGKTYKHRQSLDKHIKLQHSAQEEAAISQPGNIICKESGCNFAGRLLNTFRNHLTQVHALDFNMFQKEFSSIKGTVLVIITSFYS